MSVDIIHFYILHYTFLTSIKLFVFEYIYFLNTKRVFISNLLFLYYLKDPLNIQKYIL